MLIYNNKFTWWKTDSLNSFLGSVSIHALIMLNVVVCWLSTLFSYGGNEELVRWLVLWRPSLTQSANWFALTWGVMFLLVMQSLCITPRLLMKLRSIWLVRNPYYVWYIGNFETSATRTSRSKDIGKQWSEGEVHDIIVALDMSWNSFIFRANGFYMRLVVWSELWESAAGC